MGSKATVDRRLSLFKIWGMLPFLICTLCCVSRSIQICIFSDLLVKLVRSVVFYIDFSLDTDRYRTRYWKFFINHDINNPPNIFLFKIQFYYLGENNSLIQIQVKNKVATQLCLHFTFWDCHYLFRKFSKKLFLVTV